jgi:phosphoenolpyruvate phosphomutase
VVARVEAFIAGWGLDEALKRAEAYHHAGADAILMHSKQPTADQVLSFMEEWQDTCPVVIVPTMYYNTPTNRFAEAGISLVIWANHLVRANITAMQKTARLIFEAQSLIPVEDDVVPVKEIFRLQGAAELNAAEKQYLPSRNGKNSNGYRKEETDQIPTKADQRESDQPFQVEVS